jgi:hypothetical protein
MVASRPASATEGPDGASIAVLPLRISGEVSDVARVRIEEALLQGLQGSGARVVPPSETKNDGVGDCDDAACLGPVFESVETGHVAWLEVEGSGRDYALLMRVFGKDGLESSQRATCEICGFDEVAAMVRDEASALAGKLHSAGAPGTLVIETVPPGASVYVDDEWVGTTPIEHSIPAGEHVLRVEREGYATRTQPITAAPQVEERLHLELTEVDDGSRAKKVKGWGYGLLGVGVAGAGAGIGLLAIHHRPVKRRCEDPAAIDVNGLCRWRYNTIAPGAAVMAVGGTALLSAAAILAIASIGPKTKDVSRVRSRLRPVVGPTSVGLVGRF